MVIFTPDATPSTRIFSSASAKPPSEKRLKSVAMVPSVVPTMIATGFPFAVITVGAARRNPRKTCPGLADNSREDKNIVVMGKDCSAVVVQVKRAQKWH